MTGCFINLIVSERLSLEKKEEKYMPPFFKETRWVQQKVCFLPVSQTSLIVNDQLSYKRVCLTNNRLPLWPIFTRAHVRKLRLDWRELTWKVQFDMLSGLGAVLNRDDYAIYLIVLWIDGIKQKWIWFLSDEHDCDKNKKNDSSW